MEEKDSLSHADMVVLGLVTASFKKKFGAAFVDDHLMSTEGYLLLLCAYNLQDGEFLDEIFQMEGTVSAYQYHADIDTTVITLSLIMDEHVIVNVPRSSNERRLLEALKIGSHWRAQGYVGRRDGHLEMNATYLGLRYFPNKKGKGSESSCCSSISPPLTNESDKCDNSVV